MTGLLGRFLGQRKEERVRAREKAHKEASLWLARLSRGLRKGEGVELQEWLKNPVQRHCMLEMAHWHGPDVVSILSTLFPNSPELLQRKARRGTVSVALTATATAALVGICLMAMMGHSPHTFFTHDHQTQDLKTRTHVTAVGERRDLRLADDSVVTLNTNTRMSVSYTPTARSVYIAYGEASFQVTPDENRPFTVHAGQRNFQAVGTRFNVRVLSPNDVELTVTEGAVKVLYAPPREPDTPAKRRAYLIYGETTLNALETALVEPGYQTVSTLDPGEVETRLAWQRGLMVFKNAVLEDVLAEMARYSTTRFELADQTLRAVKINGDFRAGDVEGLLRALRKNFSIGARRMGGDRIVLMPITST